MLTLTNPPYSNLQVNFQYNTILIPPSQFWVNQEISYQPTQFDINNTIRWVSFCSSTSLGGTSFPITLNLGGDNAASYNFSTSSTTVTVAAAPLLNVPPTFSITASNVQKTFAAIQLTTNVAGFFYYELSIAPLAAPFSLSAIQTYIKNNNLILQSNNDYLTHIYIGDRDQRVGYASATVAGTNFVSINNLLPERSYTMCGYFENQFSAYNSTPTCINFTMQAWGFISKASISFNSPLLAN
jgi:hypothetical protein